MRIYFAPRTIIKYLLVLPIFFLVLVFGVFSNETYKVISHVYATDTDCSAIVDLNERLKCLQDVQNEVAQKRKEVESHIGQENKQQDELWKQISSLNTQISLLELDVQSKQILIEQKNIEINIISKEMDVISTDIAMVKQETSVLEDSVMSNISEIYKTLNTDDIEMIFNDTDVWGGLNNVKYMQVIKQNDESKILNLVDKYVVLADYETILSTKQQEEVAKKVEVENEYGELKIMQDNLVAQKSTRQVLLAESEKKEQEYKASLTILKKEENEVAAEVSRIIMELYNSGQLGAGEPVTKGTIVGFQGHTGCSLGSHLHFEIFTQVGSSKTSRNPYNYLTYSGGYVTANTNYHAPMDQALVTQGFHSGYSIDLVSMNSAYTNPGLVYWVNEQDLRNRCPHAPSRTETWIANFKKYRGDAPWSFGMRGEGAPVYAIADGTVYRSSVVAGGGNIIVIAHGNNLFSLYLHLK